MQIKRNRLERYTIQLEDGMEDKYPSIILTDNEGESVETLLLDHFEHGLYDAFYLYDGDSVRMIGQGIVYNDESRTEEDTSCKLGEEIYDVVDYALEESLQDMRIPPDMELDDDADTLTLFDTDGETILAVYDCEDAAGDPAHRNIKRFRRRLS